MGEKNKTSERAKYTSNHSFVYHDLDAQNKNCKTFCGHKDVEKLTYIR